MINRGKKILSILTMLLVNHSMFAQSGFYKNFGTNDSDIGYDVIQTTDGGYMLSVLSMFVGYLPSVIKTDGNGNMEWYKQIDVGYNTLILSMVSLNDSSVALLCTFREGSPDFHSAVINMDLSGNIIWMKKISLNANWSANSFITDGCGSIFFTSFYSADSLGRNRFGLTKMNYDGNVLWNRIIYTGDYFTPVSMVALQNNNLVIGGKCPSDTTTMLSDFAFIETDADGNFLSGKAYRNTMEDEITSIMKDGQDNVYACGRSYNPNTLWDGFLIKLNSNLDLQFSKSYSGNGMSTESFRDGVFTSRGEVAVFGDEGNPNETNLMMARFDSNGNIINQKSYPVSPTFLNYAYQGKETMDGGFVMTGEVRPPTSFRKGPIFKADANGDVPCFTQPLSLTVTDALRVPTNLICTSSLVNLVATDSLPGIFQNVIQQIDNCGGNHLLADFNYQLKDDCPKTCYTFSAVGNNLSQYRWEFENGEPAISTLSNPEVCFASNERIHIRFTAGDGNDSVVIKKEICMNHFCPIEIPNVITPNHDDKNDLFEIESIGNFPGNNIKIFNRWGREIFSMTDYDNSWPHSKLSDGIYFYIVKLPDERSYNGTITVLSAE